MANLEQYQIIGHLGRDAEMRFSPSGQAITQFSMAVTRHWKAEGDWQSRTKWIRVSAWRELAERFQGLKKGQMVFVSGRLMEDDQGNPRTWVDQNGVTRASYEMLAEKIMLLERKEAGQQAAGGEEVGGEGDDIPF